VTTVDGIIDAARALAEAVIFDENGYQGRGGNGGLISRNSLDKAYELLKMIERAKKEIK
jgi:hypothetical protein